MSPREWSDLAYVVLTAAAAGAVLAFAYLAGQRVINSATLRVWTGAILVAIPGVFLGWLLTQPELGVRSAYGGLADAVFGPESPGVESEPVSAEGLARPRPKKETRERADLTPSPTNVVSDDQEQSGSGPAPTHQPPPPSPSPTSPTPTPTPTPSPTPSPTQSPSPTPSTTPSPSPTDIVVPREPVSLDELLPLLEGLEDLEVFDDPASAP